MVISDTELQNCWQYVQRLFFFISGNDNIHTISTTTGHKLSIYLEDFNKNFKYANYSYFHLGNEHRKYQLTIGSFSGTAGLGL